jgi:asparagine synthase (glutamine-hydrolysing)
MGGFCGQLGPGPVDLSAALAALGPGADERCSRALGGGLFLDLGSRTRTAPAPRQQGPCAAVIDGAIDNLAEVRAELLGSGHPPGAAEEGCAAWVAERAGEEWGESVLLRLSGPFALALWDGRRDCLLLARDRLGERPLFFAREGERLLFATAPQALFALGVSRALEPLALPLYLRGHALPAPLTFWRAVRKLGPGERLTWGREALSTGRHWELSLGPERRGEGAAAGRAQRLLEASLGAALKAEGPAVLHSGGPFGHGLVALCARRGPVPSLFVSLPGGEEQAALAREEAARLGVPFVELPLRPQPEELLSVAGALSEPVGDPAAALVSLALQAARAHAGTVLVPWGAGELFPLGATGARASGLFAGPRALLSLPEREPRAAGREEPEDLLAEGLSRSETAALLSEGFTGGARAPVLAPLLERAPGEGQEERAAWVRLNLALPELRLSPMVLAASRLGLSLRAPFCGHRLAEHAASIAFSQRRAVFLRTLEGALPKGLHSLPDPLLRYGCDAAGLLLPARRLLDPARLAREGFFDPQGVQALLSALGQGRPGASRAVYSLLAFQRFLEEEERFAPVPP